MEQPQNKVIPNAIKRLKLCASLNDCGHSVEGSFKLSSAKVLYAYDDDVLGYSDWSEIIAPESVSRSLTVHNNQSAEIILLPLDNRIISGHAIKKGGVNDCAILTETQMSFVEFKTNVTNNSNANIEERTKDAIRQLWHTFSEIVSPRCAKLGISLANEVTIDFFIVFNSSLDVTNVTATRMNTQMEFLLDRGFPLFFDNEKTFS